METIGEKALRLNSEGCNCAQAVAGAHCERYGVDQATVLRLASGLGGGLRCGEVCGAASGAVLVIGLRYGFSIPVDKEAKEKCAAKTVAFMEAFKERFGALTCRELLEASGRAICNSLIRGAAEMLEQPEEK